MPTKTQLTEAAVRNLKAPTSDGKPACIYDTQVRGLAVLVSGKTTSKSYVVNYGTKFQRRTIGDVTLFTLDEARDRAVDMLRLMRKGIDPNTVDKPVQTQNTTITLRQLLDRRVHDEQRPLRPASVAVYRNILTKNLTDWLDKPVTSITPDMAHDRHKAIFKGVAKSDDRDGRTIADLTIRVLGSLYTYAAGLRGSDRIGGLPAINPCLGIEWFITPKDQKARQRTRHVSDADLPRFWSALSAERINPTHAVLIRLMLLTGLRVNSARQLRWGMVDLQARVISIPAGLMKGKRPLSLPIVSGLYELLSDWRARGVETSGYLFPSSVGGKCVSELRSAFECIKQTDIVVSPHRLAADLCAGVQAVRRAEVADRRVVGTCPDVNDGRLCRPE